MPPRAYSYIRFSSYKQERGDSVRRQASFAVEICEEQGWVLDDSFELHDLGVSGYRGKNARIGALADFLEAVRVGRVTPGSVLIVESIDRLSRDDVDDAYDLFRGLIKAGIVIATKSPKRIYDRASCGNNFLNLLEPLFIMYRANEESATKSYRLRQAWGQRKKAAVEDGEVLTRMTPAWIRVVEGEGGLEYEIIPEHGQAVHDIIHWSIEGLGVQKILARLNAEPDAYPCFARKGVWGERYITRILRNPAVFGQYQPYVVDPETGKKRLQGEPVDDHYPAVVGKEDFYLSRSKMKGRDRKGGRPSTDPGLENLFTHLLHHSGDKARMTMRTAMPCRRIHPNNAVVRYVVSAACRQGKKCRGQARSFPYQPLEDAVLNSLGHLKHADVASPENQPAILAQVQELTDQLTALDFQIQTYEAKFRDKATPKAAAARYMQLFEEGAAERESLVARLEKLKQEVESGRPEPLGEVQAFSTLLREGVAGDEALEVRRRLKARLKSLVDSIWVHIDRFSNVCSCCHYQIFLKGGAQPVTGHVWANNYRGEPLPPPKDKDIADMTGVDLRLGPPA